MACIRLKIAASPAVTRQAPKAQPGTHAAIRDKGFWEMKDRPCVQSSQAPSKLCFLSALCLFQVIRIIRTLLTFSKTPILSSRAVTVKERG